MSEGKAKFTPGPWSKAHLEEKGCRCGYVFGKGEQVIAKVLYNDSRTPIYDCDVEALPLAEARKNAVLIAAAPDMYAALEKLVHLHCCEQEGIDCGMPTFDQWDKALDDAVAALAKARGEAV